MRTTILIAVLCLAGCGACINGGSPQNEQNFKECKDSDVVTFNHDLGCYVCVPDGSIPNVDAMRTFNGCELGEVSMRAWHGGLYECIDAVGLWRRYIHKADPEPYIGEYYECDEHGCLCWSDQLVDGNCPPCPKKCKWHKFRKSDVLDEHKGEIKVKEKVPCQAKGEALVFCEAHTSRWQSRYFYYADVPDRFQKKREEIENENR